MKMWKLIVLTWVAVAVAFAILFALFGTDIVDDDYMMPVGVVVVLAALAAILIPAYNKGIRNILPVLEKMRQENSVAYFCSFMGQQAMPNIITANAQEIAIWKIVGNNQTEKITAFARQDVDIARGRVRVAPVRTVEGLVLTMKNDPTQKVQINLNPDKVNFMFSPKQGAELEEAIQHIKTGA